MTIKTDNLAAAQPDWMLTQAGFHYRLSCNDNYTASGREMNRRKFLAAIKQLLPIVGKDKLLETFEGHRQNCDCREARAIIEQLAGEPLPVANSERDKLTRHLTKATAELIAALKLLRPESVGV